MVTELWFESFILMETSQRNICIERTTSGFSYLIFYLEIQMLNGTSKSNYSYFADNCLFKKIEISLVIRASWSFWNDCSILLLLFKQSILKGVGENIILLDKIMASMTSNAVYQESKAGWKTLNRYTSTEKIKNMLIMAKKKYEINLQLNLCDLQYI